MLPTDAVPAGRPHPRPEHVRPMSAEDLEKYETEMELQLYREYRDVVGLFSYVVETERRFYLSQPGRREGPRRPTARCSSRSP